MALTSTGNRRISTISLTGIILAGGRGSRMGGQDKGLVDWQGSLLVEHVVMRLRPQVDSILIVANRNADTYQQWGDVVPDCIPGYEGPLAGLHAGLTTISTHVALVVPVDAPGLPLTLATGLGWEPGKVPEVPVCAHDGQRPQPLFGLYRRTDADSMADSLARGDRTLMRWHDTAGTRWVRIDTAGAFSNLNTPEDLQKVRQEPPGSPP